MTREAFDAEIEGNIHATCTLKDVGTFYLVYGTADYSTTITGYNIHLCYYDEVLKQKHRSSASLFKTNSMSDKVIALSENAFFISSSSVLASTCALLTLKDNWGTSTFCDVAKDSIKQLSEFIAPKTDIQKVGLSLVRTGTDGDFSLKSEEGQVIKVHKAVLGSLWPFFKTMMQSELKEATENELELPMPFSTLEVIVQYLYGQEMSLLRGDATRLVVFAQMYDLPELLKMAIAKIKYLSGILASGEVVYLWQKSNEADNIELREFATARLAQLMPNNTTFSEDIKDLEKDELAALLQDLCIAMGKKNTWE